MNKTQLLFAIGILLTCNSIFIQKRNTSSEACGELITKNKDYLIEVTPTN